MAALSAARKATIQRGSVAVPPFLSLPVKASTIVYQGALVVLNAGYAKGGTAATGLVAAGRAEETVDNSTGADGDKRIQVQQGVFRYGNSASGDLIAATEVGKTCYIVDDQTVAKTDNTGARSAAGKVFDVDADGVWVLIGFAV